MYPASTTYQLCQTPDDYAACHEFFRTEAIHPICRRENEGYPEYTYEPIEFPTVLATRNGKVVGVMATRRVPQGVMASPMHVAYDIKNHVPVGIRLIDHYEAALRALGVPEYFVVMPSFKASGCRIFTELRPGTLVRHILKNRYNIYQIQVI